MVNVLVTLVLNCFSERFQCYLKNIYWESKSRGLCFLLLLLLCSEGKNDQNMEQGFTLFFGFFLGGWGWGGVELANKVNILLWLKVLVTSAGTLKIRVCPSYIWSQLDNKVDRSVREKLQKHGKTLVLKKYTDITSELCCYSCYSCRRGTKKKRNSFFFSICIFHECSNNCRFWSLLLIIHSSVLLLLIL